MGPAHVCCSALCGSRDYVTLELSPLQGLKRVRRGAGCGPCGPVAVMFSWIAEMIAALRTAAFGGSAPRAPRPAPPFLFSCCRRVPRSGTRDSRLDPAAAESTACAHEHCLPDPAQKNRTPYLGSGRVKEYTDILVISTRIKVMWYHFLHQGKNLCQNPFSHLRPWVQIPETSVSFFYPVYLFFPPWPYRATRIPNPRGRECSEKTGILRNAVWNKCQYHPLPYPFLSLSPSLAQSFSFSLTLSFSLSHYLTLSVSLSLSLSPANLPGVRG